MSKPGAGTLRTPSSRALDWSADSPPRVSVPSSAKVQALTSLVVGTELRAMPESCEESFSASGTQPKGQM